MVLSTVPGQPRAVSMLTAALRHKTVHHAYLFAGPAGVGKERAALAFIQALFCPERPSEGCGACSTCRRIERLGHPDLFALMPESELVARGMAGRSDFDHVPSREIRVEQVRKLQERMALRPLESSRKAALVLDAHTMNVAAQNAFLKTLEEPPAQTVIILVASVPERLLPTIQSRCSRVQFGPLPLALIAEQVRKELKVDEGTARLLANMAGGSVSRALELDVKKLQARRALYERYESLSGDDWRGILRLAEEIGASKEDAEDALGLLLTWTRDSTLAQTGAGGLLNEDLLDFAQVCAAKHSAPSLHQRYRLIDQTLGAIARNGGPRIQVERLLLQLTEGGAS